MDSTAEIDPYIGMVIADKYQLIEKLGQGGMGAVYRAEHQMMQRSVAVKLLHPQQHGHQAGEETRSRFLREAQSASKLRHANAVSIFDFGVENDIPYLVMEYLEGRTLKQIVAEESPSVERVLPLLRQVADAISEAHALGMVHRDLKPDNVIVIQNQNGEEQAIVLDFGIVKLLGEESEEDLTLTADGKLIGTPKYMAPEQINGKPVDHRSDIYSLGVIVYEVLTGEVPFESDSLAGLLYKHVQEEPVSMVDFHGKIYPEEMQSVVLRSLAKDPEERYESAREFLDELDIVASSKSTKNSLLSRTIDIARFDNRKLHSYASQMRMKGMIAASILAFGLGTVAFTAIASAKKIEQERLVSVSKMMSRVEGQVQEIRQAKDDIKRQSKVADDTTRLLRTKDSALAEGVKRRLVRSMLGYYEAQKRFLDMKMVKLFPHKSPDAWETDTRGRMQLIKDDIDSSELVQAMARLEALHRDVDTQQQTLTRLEPAFAKRFALLEQARAWRMKAIKNKIELSHADVRPLESSFNDFLNTNQYDSATRVAEVLEGLYRSKLQQLDIKIAQADTASKKPKVVRAPTSRRPSKRKDGASFSDVMNNVSAAANAANAVRNLFD